MEQTINGFNLSSPLLLEVQRTTVITMLEAVRMLVVQMVLVLVLAVLTVLVPMLAVLTVLVLMLAVLTVLVLMPAVLMVLVRMPMVQMVPEEPTMVPPAGTRAMLATPGYVYPFPSSVMKGLILSCRVVAAMMDPEMVEMVVETAVEMAAGMVAETVETVAVVSFSRGTTESRTHYSLVTKIRGDRFRAETMSFVFLSLEPSGAREFHHF